MDRPERVDLADIVDQGEPRTRPLYIHFQFGPQSETVHALLHTDVGEDWFHDPKSPGINALALFGIDLGLHCIDQVQWLRIHRHGKIYARCGGFAQAACLHGASGTAKTDTSPASLG